MDLTNINLLAFDAPVKRSRVSYREGFTLALLASVDGDKSLLRMEDVSEEIINLDDTNIWTQKKVKEKVIQLFNAITKKKKASRVLQLGFKALRETQRISSPSFCLTLVQEGYTDKTALAQSNQVICLFKSLKIIQPTREKGVYSLNPHSRIYYLAKQNI